MICLPWSTFYFPSLTEVDRRPETREPPNSHPRFCPSDVIVPSSVPIMWVQPVPAPWSDIMVHFLSFSCIQRLLQGDINAIERRRSCELTLLSKSVPFKLPMQLFWKAYICMCGELLLIGEVSSYHMDGFLEILRGVGGGVHLESFVLVWLSWSYNQWTQINSIDNYKENVSD